MTYASGLKPYTQEERDRDHAERAKARAIRHTRRRSAPSGQYDQPPTEAQLRRDLRIMGELDRN